MHKFVLFPTCGEKFTAGGHFGHEKVSRKLRKLLIPGADGPECSRNRRNTVPENQGLVRGQLRYPAASF